MSRPIILTSEIKQKAKEEFAAMLDGIKMSSGKLNYSKSYEYKNCSAVVWLSLEAYRKIVALVMDFKDEVGWHGTVSRIGVNEFIIEDIFVYPQEVTGSTVNTDQFLYSEWLYDLEDETFNKIRMQGHSHVNMSVSPSGVDETHRQKILDQLEADMFYIFMIWNKSLFVHTLIYDMQRNILYEDNDIKVKLLEDENMSEFLEDAKAKVKKLTSKQKGVAAKKPKGKQAKSNNDHDALEDEEEFYHLFDMRYSREPGGFAWKT